MNLDKTLLKAYKSNALLKASKLFRSATNVRKGITKRKRKSYVEVRKDRMSKP